MEEKRGKLNYLSVAALVGFNLLAIIGVLFLNWSSALLLLTYWAESAIIGFFTILKIAKVENFEETAPKTKLGGNLGKVGTIMFFVFHYGGFMFIHLVFLLVFVFARMGEKIPNIFSLLLNFLIFSFILFISHLISYKTNYIKNKEYKIANAGKLFFAPYTRITPMHIAIIIGASLSFSAILLVVIKTIVDLSSHIMEHKGKEIPMSVELGNLKLKN